MKNILSLFFIVFLSSVSTLAATEKQFIPVEEVQKSLKFFDEPKDVQKARIKAFKKTPPLPDVILEYEKKDKWHCYPANKSRPYPKFDIDGYKRNMTFFSEKTYCVYEYTSTRVYYYDYNCNLVEYSKKDPLSFSDVWFNYNLDGELIKIFVDYKFKTYHFAPDGTLVGYWKFFNKYSPDGQKVIMTRSRSPIY